MNIVAETVREVLCHHEHGRLIAAVSGGADSVALLRALLEAGSNVTACHCNFHLRGEESDRDQTFVEQLCSELGIRLETVQFDVRRYMALHDDSVSVEMACRDLRYKWFEDMRLKLGASHICVAHNSDDNTETFMLNLLRGTGIAGLRGMLEVNGRHIMRPMLRCSRRQIEDYLRELGQAYVTDSTNLESLYRRNSIRLEIMPVIRRFFPNADTAIAATTDNLGATERFYRQSLEEKRSQYTLDGAIDLNTLIDNEPEAALMVYEWFAPEGLTMSQASDIVRRPIATGRRYPLHCGCLITDRGRLVKADETVTDLASSISYEVKTASEFRPVRNPDVAYFDASVLEGGGWEVRPWRDGDRLEPFGMKGSRKVSDLLSDAKVPLDMKHRVPLLVKDGCVLWVAGIRASRHYPVTDRSQYYVTVRYCPKGKN